MTLTTMRRRFASAVGLISVTTSQSCSRKVTRRSARPTGTKFDDNSSDASASSASHIAALFNSSCCCWLTPICVCRSTAAADSARIASAISTSISVKPRAFVIDRNADMSARLPAQGVVDSGFHFHRVEAVAAQRVGRNVIGQRQYERGDFAARHHQQQRLVVVIAEIGLGVAGAAGDEQLQAFARGLVEAFAVEFKRHGIIFVETMLRQRRSLQRLPAFGFGIEENEAIALLVEHQADFD